MFDDCLAPAQPIPWPPVQMHVDLKPMIQALAPIRTTTNATPGRYRRVSRLLESAPRRITAAPLAPACWLDGCQFGLVNARREHRDITRPTWSPAPSGTATCTRLWSGRIRRFGNVGSASLGDSAL